jgi:dienelactone hydrolase
MRFLKQAMLAIVFSLLFVSCKYVAMDDSPREQREMPTAMKIKYPKLWPNLSETAKPQPQKKRQAKKYSVVQYTLEFQHPDGEVRPVTVEYYQTKKVKGIRPTFTVLPILGGSYDLSRFFARWLARKGYNAAVVFRPEKWFSSKNSVDRLEKLFHRSIIEQRSVLEWLRHRPEVDIHKMGSIGTSLGAFGSVVVAAFEPSLKANFVIMGGQDVAKILPISAEPSVIKWREARMATTLQTMDEFTASAKKAIKTDPIFFSKYVDPNSVIHIITTKDKHVPTAQQWDLNKSMQKPDTYAYRIGHYSSIVYIASILARMKKQIRQRMKDKFDIE